MKKIIIVDNEPPHLDAEMKELATIIKNKFAFKYQDEIQIEGHLMNFHKIECCLAENGKLTEQAKNYGETKKFIEDVVLIINENTKTLTKGDRVELLLDFCLDQNSPVPAVLKLVKYILTKMSNQQCLKDGTFIITLMSRFIPVYIEDSISRLPGEGPSIVEFSYRPLNEENNEWEFDREKSAYPKFYTQYWMQNAELNYINDLLQGKHDKDDSDGTCYGNHFGLVLARLYK